MTSETVLADLRPPRAWGLQVAGVLAGIAATTVFSVLTLVAYTSIWRLLGPDGDPAFPAWLGTFAENSDLIGMALLVLLVAAGGAVLRWLLATERILSGIGDPYGSLRTHWSFIVWYCCLAATVGISVFDLTPVRSLGDVDFRLELFVVQGGIRVLGLLLLFIGVLQVRTVAKDRIAARGIAMRFDRQQARESAVATTANAEWTAAPAIPADDNFWFSVRDLVRAAAADLPLLEAAGPFAHRWLLVPASGDVTAVRAEVKPGARITLFAQPPAAGFNAPDGPSPFHGYLDGNYRGVTAQRVPAFLAQAANATRWGLYAAGDPIALHGLNALTLGVTTTTPHQETDPA